MVAFLLKMHNNRNQNLNEHSDLTERVGGIHVAKLDNELFKLIVKVLRQHALQKKSKTGFIHEFYFIF